MENKLDIFQKENLCELVRHKEYKEKDTEVNAWNEIVNSLDFIFDGMYYILATI